ncbi:MAG: helix-turn-helix domain-containing protein [Frankiaceae bacterium]
MEPATIAQLVADYMAGAPSAELMRTYQLGKGTVLGLLREAGVTLRHQGLSEEDLAEAKALYAAGLSVVKVANKLGQATGTVYWALKRAGVKMRSPNDRGAH